MIRLLLTYSFLAFLVLPKLAISSLFIPTPFDRQIKESSAAIQGVNNGKIYKKDNDGNIVTEYSFKLEKAVGIRTNRIINKNAFKIVVPGGKWDGKIYKTHGSPEFIDGKKYVLLLDKTPFGFTVHGLSIGQYEIKTEDGKDYLKSFIFSGHPKVGSISYEDFESILIDNFGTGLEETTIKDTNVYVKSKFKKRTGRKIASIKEDAEEENSVNIFWLALILAGLGLFTTINLNRRKP